MRPVLSDAVNGHHSFRQVVFKGTDKLLSSVMTNSARLSLMLHLNSYDIWMPNAFTRCLDSIQVTSRLCVSSCADMALLLLPPCIGSHALTTSYVPKERADMGTARTAPTLKPL